jgi:hypothetical protein
VVQQALGALERLADAQALGAVLPGGGPVPAALLTGLVEVLRALPEEGEALLAAARSGDGALVANILDERFQRAAGVPGALHHHLAIVSMRAADKLEDSSDTTTLAVEQWQRAWRHWLAFLSSEEGQTSQTRPLLLDHLLALHRKRLNDLLRQGDVELARRYSELVRKLPEMVGSESTAAVLLRDDLTARIDRFRDELATEHLLSTREAMKFGDVPEGWRADYERGLGQLRRLMALDRDNVRLLTAVVETCAEWFLDLYHAQDSARMRQEVDRYTPLATHLVRLIGSQSKDHPARPALSEFYKFRGFVEPNVPARIALYQEALRLHPANENVRELLENLGVEMPPPPPPSPPEKGEDHEG